MHKELRDDMAGEVRFMTDQDVANILLVTVLTVRRWRRRGRGPVFVKLGGIVRYHPDDVKKFIDSLPRLQATPKRAGKNVGSK